MRRVAEWIKRHKFCASLILLGIFLLPILIIHLLFKVENGPTWLKAKWDAGDILAYITGFEALCGTIFWGGITAKQSEEAQEVNKRLSQENNHLQKLLAQRLMPLVKVDLLEVLDAKEGDNAFLNLGLVLKM